MRHYRMSFAEVMETPVRVFWTLNKNVGRLQAEEDLRALPLFRAGMSGGEAASELHDRLVEEMGNVAKQDDEVLDRKGLDELRTLSQMG